MEPMQQLYVPGRDSFHWLVVMGVSGCGKSRVGAAIAERIGLPLVEGDEFHGEANRALMRSGDAGGTIGQG